MAGALTCQVLKLRDGKYESCGNAASTFALIAWQAPHRPYAITLCTEHPGQEAIGSRTRDELREYVKSLDAEPIF